MSKNHFIALAEAVKKIHAVPNIGGDEIINILADFCQSQNPAFKRERWIGYIKGENGPNGGEIKG